MSLNPYNSAIHPIQWLIWEREGRDATAYEVCVEWERLQTGWHERQRQHDAEEEKRLSVQREKIRARRERKRAWTEGVAKIMAEVRRREALRGLPAAPFFTSDNPLDGARLWDNS